MKHTAGAGATSREPDILDDVRQRFIAAGIPYAIENVVGAGKLMRNPIGLCGTMFGLQVARHRLFECNFEFRIKTWR